ncbi:MAG: hypothetical protein V4726_17840 [Verrucomicrobiota bacterium]
MNTLRLTPLLVMFFPSLLHAAPPVGFEETFALAADRAAVLKELIPGTPEYYYYSALHAQNSGQSAEAARLLKEWKERYPADDAQRELLGTRQHFLDYSTDPAGTLAWLKDSRGLNFDHARETAGTPPEIPTSLDLSLITWDAFFADALRQDRTLKNLTDSGLRSVLWRGIELNSEARRALLSRVTRPDLPGLAELILADLKTKESQGFGEFTIHRNLLLEQLATLLKRLPALLQNQAFVETWMLRLTPPDGVDPERDSAVRLAWLERQQAFTDTLAPPFNSLKASVLYQRLEFDLRRNVCDPALLAAYLKLPRNVIYLNPEFRKRADLFHHPADLGGDFTGFTGRGPIRQDDDLVRRCLLLLLAKNPDTALFKPWVEDAWLKAILAEAQLTAKPEAADKFVSLLPPAAYQQLRTRTDLEFDPGCREDWLPQDEVALDLYIKNVPQLLVKVFEINTENVHRSTGQQVNTDLDLDGLVANREFSADYADPPLQRVRRTFKFPELNGRRGVWVIEFIGGGKSSRALVRKGSLSVLPASTPGGTRLTVLDENTAPVPGAYALLGSQRFAADAAGHILLPFSTTPGPQNVIIGDGSGFTTLENIGMQGENYTLSAGLHVPRESLLPGHKATAVLRPAVLCNGRPMELSALENPKLTVNAVSLDGIPSVTVIPLKDLSPDKETLIPFSVPDRVSTITLTVSGEVKSLITAQPVQVSAATEFRINGITLTAQTGDLHLSRNDSGWSLSLLGRNGEALANRQVGLSFVNPDFTVQLPASLRTDEAGKVQLGRLDGLSALTANSGISRVFGLPKSQSAVDDEIHLAEGDVLRLPWPLAGEESDPAKIAGRIKSGFSLIERRGDAFARSVTEGIALEDGALAVKGLKPGTYAAFLEGREEEITVRVAAGKIVDGHLLNPALSLELSNPDPLAITGMSPGTFSLNGTDKPVEALTFRIAHATKDTRVHVMVSRFLPEFDAFAPLGDDALPDPELGANIWRPSLYQSARTIGEEYRYVLERRSHKVFAGNLLPRPGLLLNPWVIASTSTDKQEAAAGEALQAMRPEKQSAVKRKEGSGSGGYAVADELAASAGTVKSRMADESPDLSFLAQPGATAFNLKPDAKGDIRIAAAALGHGQIIRVLAVSGDSAAMRDFTVPEKPLLTKDLRLAKGLDPAGHFTRQNSVSILEKDAPFALKDALSAEFETYSHLGNAWDLLFNLSKNPTLAEFSFLRTWPTLTDARKRELYSKYASHELSFFLSRKDPVFFKTVVLPYLANKRDRTFLDDYLLGGDVTPWLFMAKYATLNTAEKLLLARRPDDSRRAAAARDITDFLNSQPRDPAKDAFWFESALSTSQVDARNDALFDSMDEVVSLNRGRYTSDEAAAAAPADAPESHMTPAPAPASPMSLGIELKQQVAEQETMTKLFRRRSFGGVEGAGPREAAKAAALYRQTELTKEWAENNYWQLLIAAQNADLIKPNRFWQDYAKWDGASPFLSTHLSEAAGSFSEIMLALGVLDLPFETDAKPAKTEMKDNVLTLTPTARTILFHQEIKPAEADKEGPPLLVSQNFYRDGDRYTEENGEKSDKFVSGEFLSGTVYGCQIVVSNPGSATRRLDVLFQIPVGALPVNRTRVTQSAPLALGGFQTQTLDFQFYFPKAGKFAHYPVHVSRVGKVAASAAPVSFNVVDTLSTLDKTSWDYLSQQGSNEEVLTYLDTHNLYQTNLDRIAWRLKDRAFYLKIRDLVQARKFPQRTVLSYSVLHKDEPGLREFIALENNLPAEPLVSPLLTIDPVERKTFQWLEYSPLVNARAHRLGGDRVILNDKFRAQYEAWLRLLTFRPALSGEDCLGITAALLLQDRLDEAQAWFAKVDAAKIHERLQYDWLQGWLAFSTEDLATARRIAAARTGSPLPDRWQAKFQEMAAQLDEIDGKKPAEARPEDRDARQDRAAAAQPQFALKVENKAVTLDYRNVSEVTVNYYPMDLEFLFSANPFVSQDTSRFRNIRPNKTEKLALAPGQTVKSFPLPQEYQNSNVLVEITTAGQTKAAASYANQLDLQVSENYGILQVRHAGDQRPLPKVYVKVFADINGTPTFYKDGYTDLRGKFDYTSLSTSDLDKTKRFSLLVLSPDHGATVREVAPPAR